MGYFFHFFSFWVEIHSSTYNELKCEARMYVHCTCWSASNQPISLSAQTAVKVQLFWEGHKNLGDLPSMRKISQIFMAFSEKLNFMSSLLQMYHFGFGIKNTFFLNYLFCSMYSNKKKLGLIFFLWKVPRKPFFTFSYLIVIMYRKYFREGCVR